MTTSATSREVVTEATKSGAYVLWIGMPIMQPYSYNQGIMILNALYQEGVTSESNATFVPIWSLFANPEGEFESQAAVNGVETTLRVSDGIHFSFTGEDVLATYVIREMLTCLPRGPGADRPGRGHELGLTVLHRTCNWSPGRAWSVSRSGRSGRSGPR